MRKHFAIKSKARIFRYFDRGKKPADIAENSLRRSTLYQYYAEWRRENGIPGKATGFALRPFVRKSFGAVERHHVKQAKTTRDSGTKVPSSPDVSGERENLDNFILDCHAIIAALKHPKAGSFYLPGSKKECYLADILRIKERESGKPAFLTYDRYIELFSRWVIIARNASNKADFYRISAADGIGYTAPGL
jgi:hypothetical protein